MFTITFTVKVAIMAKLFINSNINSINIVVAFVAKINVKIVRDVIIVDVTRYDVIVVVWWNEECEGDLTTSRTSEEGAAGLLLALPSTAKTKEEEMPCVGSLLLNLPLLQLPQEQQPFSQGLNVIINTFGKGGEGGEEEKKEVPARGSLLQSKQRNIRKETRHAASTPNKIKNKSKETKTQKLNVKILGRFRKEPFVGGVIPTPHPHPTPPVACGWGLPAWGGGR